MALVEVQKLETRRQTESEAMTPGRRLNNPMSPKLLESALIPEPDHVFKSINNSPAQVGVLNLDDFDSKEAHKSITQLVKIALSSLRPSPIKGLLMYTNHCGKPS